MTIADRFDEAVRAAARTGLEGPELLPERLVRAAAAMLPVADAGLSLLDRADRRIPLASSSPEAARAERLQFTIGDGPCAEVQRLRAPVFAPEAELHRRWPAFTERLLALTPYRGIVALPLAEHLAGVGAIDLYFSGTDRMTELPIFDAVSVASLITSALSESVVFSDWAVDDGPAWLHGPPARRRARVWQAVGRLSLRLDVDNRTALDLLRSHAAADGRELEDLALDVLADRLDPAVLRGCGGPG